MKTIGVIGGILAIIAVAFGAYFHLDKTFFRHAEAEELSKQVSQIGKRLDQKIISDRLDNLQERIWKVEDRINHTKRPPSITILEELRILKDKKEKAKEELQKLEKK